MPSSSFLSYILAQTKEKLCSSGIENPGLEARALLKEVADVSDADLIAGNDKKLSEEQRAVLESFIKRRKTGEPLSRILGMREFWSLPFKVTPAVLDPRPDTETLVAAVLKRYGDKPPRRILDLGTGSGCILIALLHEWRQARGVAVDISQEALEVARDNAQRNGVAERIEFVRSNWCANVEGQFDLVVANPPYIPARDIESLDKEVRDFDPILALAGGEDGLQAYKKILTEIKSHLLPDSLIFFEIGNLQSRDIAGLAGNAGFFVHESYPDLSGIIRVVELSLGEN